jgi:germination protein M
VKGRFRTEPTMRPAVDERRTTMKRLIGFGIALGLMATACAEGIGTIGTAPSPRASTPPTSASPTPSVTPTGSPNGNGSTPTPSPPNSPPSGQSFTYQLWFVDEEGFLAVVSRTEPFEPGVGGIALTRLLEGPNGEEADAGLGTAIPGGVDLNGLSIGGGVATVDLSSDFEAGGGSLAETLQLAQVVYTITQFDTVDSVRFELDGDPVEFFGGHGIDVRSPQTRQDYDDYVALVIVMSPTIGERVDNPVSISGTANVFEATVSIRIRDADGDVVASTFTTATCGTGCRGTYSATVSYTVSQEQAGTIEVFESSAQDGSPLHMVSIPVILTP